MSRFRNFPEMDPQVVSVNNKAVIGNFTFAFRRLMIKVHDLIKIILEG